MEYDKKYVAPNGQHLSQDRWLQGARLRISRFRVKLIFFARRATRPGKPNSGSLAPHGYPRTVRAPRETREVPRRPRQVTEGPGGAMEVAATACCGLASRDATVKSTVKPSQSLRLLRLRRGLCLRRRRRRSSSTPAPSLLQPPDTSQKTRNAHQPQRQHLHTRIRVQREHFRDQHRPRGRERRRDQSGRGVEVAGHGRRGAAPARRLHREGGARHLSYGASTACCSCVNLCCSTCW